MKNSQRITKIHLSVNDQDIPAIFGIVSQDPDYKLSLKLNKELGISLKNSDPVAVSDEEGKEFLFSKFSDSSSAQGSVFQLVSNRSEGEFLLKKLKNIDYVLLIHDPGKNYNLEQVLLLVREIESITGVFNIEFKALKDRNLKYLA